MRSNCSSCASKSVNVFDIQNVIDRAREFDITVDDVALTELRFGREFTAAVEAKQVAQQDAERSKFIVDKALEEKRSN